jgi:hypothetical protein
MNRTEKSSLGQNPRFIRGIDIEFRRGIISCLTEHSSLGIFPI